MPEKKNDPHIGLWTPAVYAAAHVARRLHLGQYDKGGNDYFTSHLLKVGGAGETWKQQVVGFLHDAEEDTHHDVDTVLRMVKQLLQKWSEHPEDKSWLDIFKGHDIPPCSNDAITFPTDDDWKEIADALRFLNHHTEPVREKYIQRFGGNILALHVKMKDMENNMDISRISHPTAKDYERLERYKVEYEMLKKMLSEYEGKE
ncbi:MAG: phosphohydrolase [Prevotella sp.]|nr:phosphohydrolase [Prevotella sp.]